MTNCSAHMLLQLALQISRLDSNKQKLSDYSQLCHSDMCAYTYTYGTIVWMNG